MNNVVPYKAMAIKKYLPLMLYIVNKSMLMILILIFMRFITFFFNIPFLSLIFFIHYYRYLQLLDYYDCHLQDKVDTIRFVFQYIWYKNKNNFAEYSYIFKYVNYHPFYYLIFMMNSFWTRATMNTFELAKIIVATSFCNRKTVLWCIFLKSIMCLIACFVVLSCQVFVKYSWW